MSTLLESNSLEGIKHESFTQNVRLPEDFGHYNCMAGVMASAINTIACVDLSVKQVLQDLPEPFKLKYMSLSKMSEATQSVAQKNNLQVYWYKHEIKYNKKSFVESIVGHLKEGSLVHLNVYADKWKRNVYARNDKLSFQAHAILVEGYEKHDNLWGFSIYDPMKSARQLISADKVFDCVFGSEFGKINEFTHVFNIPIGVFEGLVKAELA